MKTPRPPRSVRGAARSAVDHPALEWLARAGFVMNGILHLLVGWIAIRIATGSGGEEASHSGALAEIASAPGGQALLWAGAVGFLALGLWQVVEMILGSEEASDRAKAGAKAAVYLALGVTTARFASGGSDSDSETASGTTAGLLGSGAGKVALVVAGLVIIGVGAHHVYTGVTKKFVEELERTGGGTVGRAIVVSGQLGYIAKGAALVILGGLVIAAVATADPEKAGGLDAALRTVGAQPFGQILLITTGVGIALYGVYSIARARYSRM
ncbi:MULTISPECIES: DUF1206 domain-containing protein [unclassified Dietzia]|uniref:DUF1206 domain-containing protein n=1 Tax=unclassified Dietzia TaxID=2617939 RepID=UPI00037DCBCD|nr:MULTISPECIES: DUF1206 domain-containing protein [unclassified Dietzia]AVZ39112.1 DUF1206 domain-containing protein [Dietzia sp. JS16-p6b]EYT64423.1 membrane protein [Dietzia sp. UCD-THP]MBB1023432.1 DUF1206 domain-containing protein [Dietzia sp. DQ12-76]MBB1026219.1 DUF1206 domain-containing protein [Dietzia sp. DQ11-38-2]